MKKGSAYTVILVLLALTLLGGCQVNIPPWRKLTGKGTVVAQDYSLNAEKYTLVIRDIQFASSDTGTLEIDEELPDALTLSTQANVADTITVTVDDSTASIWVQGDKKYRYQTDDFKIQIGVPLEKVEIDGGFTLHLNLPSLTEFFMGINGAVSGSLAFGQLDSFELVINGASSLSMTGQCSQCAVEINGASDIDASGLDCLDASVSINGAASYLVAASRILEAQVNGVGTITYIGSPQITKRVAGLGSVKPKED